MSTKLGFAVEGKELIQPTSFYDITYKALSSDYTNLANGKGFYFKGGDSGKYRAVTLTQYLKAGGTPSDGDTARDALIVVIVAASNYVDLYLAAYQWCDTPCVFIESTDAAGTTINIGHY